MSKETLTVKTINWANELGFSSIGFAKAMKLEKEADLLERWLNLSYHGSMAYMENHFEQRINPAKLVEGAKTVISLTYNYFPSANGQQTEVPKISAYAYGKDYHKVIKKKLISLLEKIENEVGQMNGRCFVDSAPVMERVWARRAGLGWLGKNTLLINPTRGSYYFLAEIILDHAFQYSHPLSDHCGTCTRCIDACPTEAIAPRGYILDASRCISYLTIEMKDEIPGEFRGKLYPWVFGCDICQEVCPWNRFSTPHNEPKFHMNEKLKSMSKDDWIEMTEEVFEKAFLGSPVKRTKFKGLRRNIDFLFPKGTNS